MNSWQAAKQKRFGQLMLMRFCGNYILSHPAFLRKRRNKQGDYLLSHPRRDTIIGLGKFHFRVRYGNEWNIPSIVPLIIAWQKGGRVKDKSGIVAARTHQAGDLGVWTIYPDTQLIRNGYKPLANSLMKTLY